jgi:TolB-like protein
MRRDEEGTLERLTQLMALASAAITRHAGRIFGAAGDSFMAEFASPVEALRCANEIHAELRQIQTARIETERLRLRIGINLDDVMCEGENVYGDGVNIAARLQAIADGDSTVIGQAVYEHVRNHVAVSFEDLGKRSLKNIAQPVHVFRVVGGADVPPRRWRGRKLAFLAIPAIVLLVLGLVFLRQKPLITDVSSLQTMAPKPPVSNSIAVLPFVNSGGETELQYLTDGLTEDLTTDLSKIRALLVIAENSTSVFRGKEISPRTAASQLGVRYVLDGNLRRVGEQLRINVQLIDGSDGRHIWGDRWDVQPSGFFQVQDQLVANIVRALALSLSAQEQERIYRRDTQSMPAYEAFRRGWAHLLRQTPDGLGSALAEFRRAVALDANYTRAYAAIGQTYWNAWVWGWESSVGETWETAPGQAEHYLNLAMLAPTATAYQLGADVNLYARRFDEAIAFARLAIEYDPNDPVSHVKLAESLIYSGRPELGQESIQTAMRLDPFYRPYDLFVEGLALFGQEKYARAIPLFREALKRNPDDFAPAAPLAAALHSSGQSDAAAEALKTYIAGWSEANIEEIKIYWPFRNQADEDRLVVPLRALGLPETLQQ